MGRKTLTSEEARRIGALGAAAAKAKLEREARPPEGWPSWPAFRRDLRGDHDGPHSYWMTEPMAIRTIAEAESEMA
jgi:hypothetical protein